MLVKLGSNRSMSGAGDNAAAAAAAGERPCRPGRHPRARLLRRAGGPGQLAATAGIMRSRGWARVPSHAEIATVCPGRTRERNGGPLSARSAPARVAAASAAASTGLG